MTSRLETFLRSKMKKKVDKSWSRAKDIVIKEYGTEVVLKATKDATEVTVGDVYDIFNQMIMDIRNKLREDPDLSSTEALKEVEEGA